MGIVWKGVAFSALDPEAGEEETASPARPWAASPDPGPGPSVTSDNNFLNQNLPVIKRGSALPSRCLHPECRDKFHFVQKLKRHYYERHGTPDEGRIAPTKRYSEKEFKKHQTEDTKVALAVSMESFRKAFPSECSSKNFLNRMRDFLLENKIAVYVSKKGHPMKRSTTHTNPHKSTELPSLGLKEHCSDKHGLLQVFTEVKTIITQKATDKKKTVNNARGYISRIIGFCEKRIRVKKDRWDTLRFPDLHQQFINNLFLSDLKSSSRENFKKQMELLLKWTAAGNGVDGAGRLRSHSLFPKDPADLDAALPKIAVMWSDFGAHLQNVPLVQQQEAEACTINVEAYDQYFSKARVEGIKKNIAALKTHTTCAEKWEKKNNRYDEEIAKDYNEAVRYMACVLVHKSERGGVPTTLTMAELKESQVDPDSGLYVIKVKNHKNSKHYGDLTVFLDEDEAQLFADFLGLRIEMQKVGFTSPVLLVGLDDEPIRNIYKDILGWGKTTFGDDAPLYSSRSVRRSVTTEAKENHPQEVFDLVAKKQNHLKETANKSYVARKTSEDVKAYRASILVKNNSAAGNFALKNLKKLFPIKSPTQPLPTHQVVQERLVMALKLSPDFELSEVWVLCPGCSRRFRTDRLTAHLKEHYAEQLSHLKWRAADVSKLLRQMHPLLVTPQSLAARFDEYAKVESKLVTGLRMLGFSVVTGLSLQPYKVEKTHKSAPEPPPTPAVGCLLDGQDFPVQPAPEKEPCLKRSIKPVARTHKLLAGLPLGEGRERAARRLLAQLAFCANAEEPDEWMLTDGALLKRFVFIRAGLSANTLRKDLSVLLAVVRSTPDVTIDKHEAVFRLQDALSVLGRPVGGQGRAQSAAIQHRVDQDDYKIDEWLDELERVCPGSDPVSLRPRSVSRPWIAVARHLYHSVAQTKGFAATGRSGKVNY
ncbi:hypothetical protein ONE63_008140 [Megalurothrips usitatus]|uniref:C2H2-type domain-containing protein n=1 Tax=Megalurothrips usitatus TaxID=439358 RepID=A0AAV7XQ01_9NEOP|nr:hypothetical protein ONE63_008140 [Megalurothrips usitatus]